jgi:hypothetical protein
MMVYACDASTWDCEFETSLGYVVRLCFKNSTQPQPNSTQTKKTMKV